MSTVDGTDPGSRWARPRAGRIDVARERVEQRVESDAKGRRKPRVELFTRALVEIARGGPMAEVEVMIRGGDLDEALHQATFLPRESPPERLPGLVRLEVPAGIELRDALEEVRLIRPDPAASRAGQRVSPTRARTGPGEIRRYGVCRR